MHDLKNEHLHQFCTLGPLLASPLSLPSYLLPIRPPTPPAHDHNGLAPTK